MAYYKDTKTGKTYTSPSKGRIEVDKPARASNTSYIGSKLKGTYVQGSEYYTAKALGTSASKAAAINEVISRQQAAQNTKSMVSKQNTGVIAGASTEVGQIFTDSAGIKRNNPVTAWSTIADNYYASNWFNKLYQKIDYGFGGYLPGGINRTLVKAADTETKAEYRRLLAAANEEENTSKLIEDYSNVDWYEQIPIIGDYFVSPEEKQYQANQSAIREQYILREQATGASNAGFSIPDLTETKSSINFGDYALMGVAVLLGVMVLSK